MRASACSSVFNKPLLDAGVGRGGDQGVVIDPGQAANVVQPVGICRQGGVGAFYCKVSLPLIKENKSNKMWAVFFPGCGTLLLKSRGRAEATREACRGLEQKISGAQQVGGKMSRKVSEGV